MLNHGPRTQVVTVTFHYPAKQTLTVLYRCLKEWLYLLPISMDTVINCDVHLALNFRICRGKSLWGIAEVTETVADVAPRARAQRQSGGVSL